MSEVAKSAQADKWERIRRLRYGHVLKLIRHRYGACGVPDDDGGRPDLLELVWLASAALVGAEKKVRHCIELYAPWMDEEETAGLIELVAMTPTYQKAKTSQELGNLILLTNAERERLKLYSIRPHDLTPEEFEAQSKARKKAARTSQRRRDGVKPRADYLAECRNIPKPWLADGVSRRTWERRCRKVGTDMSQGQGPTIVTKAEPHLASQQEVGPKKSLQEEGLTETLRHTADEEQAEGTKGDLQAKASHPASTPADDLRRVREARVAILEAQWRNRHAPKEVG
jgi:hypothetical protein